MIVGMPTFIEPTMLNLPKYPSPSHLWNKYPIAYKILWNAVKSTILKTHIAPIWVFMKKLKRYQYERYAILCQLAYPDADAQYQKVLDPFHERHLVDKYGRMSVRILWVEITNWTSWIGAFLCIGALQGYSHNRCIQARRLQMTHYRLENYWLKC